MFRAPRVLGLVGTCVLMAACTGSIGDGTPGLRPGTPPPAPRPGDPTPPPGTPDPLDPPATITGTNRCITAGKPGARMLRRLSAEQLDNTVRDLFKSADVPRSDVFNDPQVL